MSGVEPQSHFAPLDSQWGGGLDTIPGLTMPGIAAPIPEQPATPAMGATEPGRASPLTDDGAAPASASRLRGVLLSAVLVAAVGVVVYLVRGQSEMPTQPQGVSADVAPGGGVAAPIATQAPTPALAVIETPVPAAATPATESASGKAIKPVNSAAATVNLPRAPAPAQMPAGPVTETTAVAPIGQAQSQQPSNRPCTPDLAALALCKSE